MPKVETEALRSAAKSIREQVIPQLEKVDALTPGTEVSAPGFGLALFFITNTYNDFRTYMLDSVKAAKTQMDTAQKQIDQAASHWEKVEAAIAAGFTP